MKFEEYTFDDKAEFNEYDPASPHVYETIKKVLLESLPDAQIDHIGSTAAKVGGKGIIDIQLVVQSYEIEKPLQLGLSMGIQPRKKQPVSNPRVVLVGSLVYNKKRYNFHVHLMKPGHPTIKNAIFFRDYLLSHLSYARRYEELKKQAIKEGKVKNEEYNPVKEPLIKEILRYVH